MSDVAVRLEVRSDAMEPKERWHPDHGGLDREAAKTIRELEERVKRLEQAFQLVRNNTERVLLEADSVLTKESP